MNDITTEDQITNAVTADLGATYGEEHMITSWILIGECVAADGERQPYLLTSPDISHVEQLGLLESGRLMMWQEFMA